jgi:hypothetical protein
VVGDLGQPFQQPVVTIERQPVQIDHRRPRRRQQRMVEPTGQDPGCMPVQRMDQALLGLAVMDIPATRTAVAGRVARRDPSLAAQGRETPLSYASVDSWKGRCTSPVIPVPRSAAVTSGGLSVAAVHP